MRTTKTAVQKATFTRPSMLTVSDAMSQIGTVGIKRIGPYIREEFLRELQGTQGRALYTEMYKNSPIVRRGVRAIKMPLLAAGWEVTGAEGPDAEEAQQFVQTCMDDMSHSWYEMLDELITGCVVYGATWFQIIYKRRMGPDQKDPAKRSKFDDNLIGWRKWSPRGQETWDGFVFDEDGDVEALRQYDRSSGQTAIVPLSQSLLFRVEGRMGDPEGESMLRAAYLPYYGIKHIAAMEQILTERMGGVPVFEVQDGGPNLFDATDPAMVTLYGYLQDVATALRIDEQMGVIIPPGIKFRLEAANAQGKVDTDTIIRRLSWELLGALLAQFLELGQAQHGSFSKSQSDQEFFLAAIDGILTHVIADTINAYEMPRLFKLNADAFNLTTLPHVKPGSVQVPNLADLADPVSKLVQVMAITPDAGLEAYLRQVGKLPESNAEEMAPETAHPNVDVGEATKRQFSIKDILAGEHKHGNQ